jgi:hypothetical protein
VNDTVQISRFINIVEYYWLHIDPPLAQSLLGRSAIIGWEKSLPLLDSVESNAEASSKIKATVKDYKELILETNNKN